MAILAIFSKFRELLMNSNIYINLVKIEELINLYIVEGKKKNGKKIKKNEKKLRICFTFLELYAIILIEGDSKNPQ